MLQRIQTIYLIISGLLTGALYTWYPKLTGPDGSFLIERNEPLILSLLIGTVVLILASIINFKKRKLQFVLNRLSIILNFVLLGVFVYRSLNLPGETLVSEKGIGVLVPVISIVFLVLANKAILRDENLVKSVDRLR